MNTERICYGCFAEKEPGMPCPHCGFNEKDEQPYLALPLGTILNGRYLTGKVLGVGGFGITYLGYDLTLEITVAVKEYMPSALATRHPNHYSVALTGRVEEDYQYGMERFLDEAKILAKLQNTPHIVSVQNYFRENGTAYFVMEYVDGMSLKSYLKKNGDQIPCDQAISILRPIMEALVQVHAMNLLHRDISPDNIYITANGDSRLLDFGAARFALGDGKSVSVILKHGYAPEEQYSSHGNQGPWTDVYAMGATLYRCITGQLPPDSVERIHGDTTKTPSELGVRIPANVENAIMKALSVRTEDRFPNMETFLSALDGQIPVQEQVMSSISRRTQSTAHRQGTYRMVESQRPSPGRVKEGAGKRAASPGFLSSIKRHPVVFGVVGGLLVLILLFFLLLAFSGGEEETTTGGGGSGGGSAPVADQPSADGKEPETEPQPEPSVEMVTRDLGNINATIDIPSSYEVTTEDGLNFVNDGKNGGGGTIMISYAWDEIFPLLGDWDSVRPIYSLADVESQREAIVARMVSEDAKYQILAAGPDQVGSADAYQILYETINSEGNAVRHIIMAVEGYEYGCYFIYAGYSGDDKATEEQMYSTIQTFASNGRPKTVYKGYYTNRSKLQVVVDNSVAEGRVRDVTIDMGSAGAVPELVIYPTDEAMEAGFGSTSKNAGIVEIMYAGQMALDSPEDVIQYMRKTAKNLGASVGKTYTVQKGGVEWQCIDMSMKHLNFKTASAMIDDRCYSVGCTYTSSNQQAVDTLYNQAMSTVHYWEE